MLQLPISCQEPFSAETPARRPLSWGGHLPDAGLATEKKVPRPAGSFESGPFGLRQPRGTPGRQSADQIRGDPSPIPGLLVHLKKL